jgi:phosphoglycolate phosphatase
MNDTVRKVASTAVTREIRLIVFDWDGTLMDSEEQIVTCLRAAIRDLSLEPLDDETLRNVIGLGLREAVDMLVPGRDAAFHQDFVGHYRRHWFNSRGSRLFAGVPQMLHTCRQHRLLLGIATGKSRRGLDRVLAENGLSDCFDATRCADEAPSTPHPQMLYDIMARLGVSAEQVIMVGDTEYDMEMASNAGVARVAVCSGVHCAARLQRHGPLACLPQAAAIPAWLSEAGFLSV